MISLGSVGRDAATPAVSVVMPARNAAPYIDEAVASILAQTFTDFELVIRDDGSTDGTQEKLRGLAAADTRIRLFEGGAQLGPAGSSNWVVEQARAPLIARLDADDIAARDRLERQVRVMQARPEVMMVGGLNHVMRHDGTVFRGPEYWRIRRRSAFAPFAHSTIMFRREAFDAVGGYRARCDYWEDLDFYLRIAGTGPVAVIAASLVSYRLSPLSCRLKADRDRVEAALDTMYRCLEKAEAGEGYEALLDATPSERGRVAPMAFVALSSLLLWRGARPNTFRRLLRQGRLGANRESFKALVWAVGAALSPPLLRRVIELGIARKERRARGSVTPDAVFLWRVWPAAAQPRHARADGREEEAKAGKAALAGAT